jgi:hypothetical protein
MARLRPRSTSTAFAFIATSMPPIDAPQKDQNGDQSPEAAQKHNQPKAKRHGGCKDQKTDRRAKMTDDAPCQGHRSHSAKAKR